MHFLDLRDCFQSGDSRFPRSSTNPRAECFMVPTRFLSTFLLASHFYKLYVHLQYHCVVRVNAAMEESWYRKISQTSYTFANILHDNLKTDDTPSSK